MSPPFVDLDCKHDDEKSFKLSKKHSIRSNSLIAHFNNFDESEELFEWGKRLSIFGRILNETITDLWEKEEKFNLNANNSHVRSSSAALMH